MFIAKWADLRAAAAAAAAAACGSIDVALTFLEIFVAGAVTFNQP